MSYRSKNDQELIYYQKYNQLKQQMELQKQEHAAKLRELNEKQSENSTLQNEIQSLQNQSFEMQKQNKKLKQINKQLGSNEGYQILYNQITELQQKENIQLSTFQVEKNRLQQQIQDLQQQNQKLNSENNKLLMQIQNIQQEQSEVAVTMQIQETKRQSQAFQSFRQQIQQLNIEKNELLDQNAEYEIKISNLESQIFRLQEAQNYLKQIYKLFDINEQHMVNNEQNIKHIKQCIQQNKNKQSQSVDTSDLIRKYVKQIQTDNETHDFSAYVDFDLQTIQKLNQDLSTQYQDNMSKQVEIERLKQDSQRLNDQIAIKQSMIDQYIEKEQTHGKEKKQHIEVSGKLLQEQQLHQETIKKYEQLKIVFDAQQKQLQELIYYTDDHFLQFGKLLSEDILKQQTQDLQQCIDKFKSVIDLRGTIQNIKQKCDQYDEMLQQFIDLQDNFGGFITNSSIIGCLKDLIIQVQAQGHQLSDFQKKELDVLDASKLNDKLLLKIDELNQHILSQQELINKQENIIHEYDVKLSEFDTCKQQLKVQETQLEDYKHLKNEEASMQNRLKQAQDEIFQLKQIKQERDDVTKQLLQAQMELQTMQISIDEEKKKVCQAKQDSDVINAQNENLQEVYKSGQQQIQQLEQIIKQNKIQLDQQKQQLANCNQLNKELKAKINEKDYQLTQLQIKVEDDLLNTQQQHEQEVDKLTEQLSDLQAEMQKRQLRYQQQEQQLQQYKGIKQKAKSLDEEIQTVQKIKKEYDQLVLQKKQYEITQQEIGVLKQKNEQLEKDNKDINDQNVQLSQQVAQMALQLQGQHSNQHQQAKQVQQYQMNAMNTTIPLEQQFQPMMQSNMQKPMMSTIPVQGIPYFNMQQNNPMQYVPFNMFSQQQGYFQPHNQVPIDPNVGQQQHPIPFPQLPIIQQ